MLIKKNKDEINLKSLRKAYLIKVENDEGYIEPSELNSFYDFCIEEWEKEKKDWYGNSKLTIKPIIIKKPSKKFVPSEVKEYLTGESFNYATIQRKIKKSEFLFIDIEDLLFDTGANRCKMGISKHDRLDTFILSWYPREEDENITTDDFFEYMKQCGDIDEYRKELQKLKENTKIIRFDVKERERQEELERLRKENIKALKYRLLNVCFEEIKKNPKIIDVCIDIISNDMEYLKNAPIEEVTKRIKQKYKLSDEDCADTIVVLLRLQSVNELDKKKTKNM